jgi:hypothetical protein
MAEGGREEFYSMRVAKPGGVPLDTALRAFGDPARVALLEQAEEVVAEFHSGKLPRYVSSPTDWRASNEAADLRRQLMMDLFAHLASENLMGLQPRGGSGRVPPDRWSSLISNSVGGRNTSEGSWLEEVLIVPARLAPLVKPANSPAKAHTVADESSCARWLEEEWPQVRERTRWQWFELAKQKWPHLSAEGFRRAWAEARKIHSEMGQPGRRKRG